MFPSPSVERTASLNEPVPGGVQRSVHRRQLSGPSGVSIVAVCQVFPPSSEISTFVMPRLPAKAIPPMTISPPDQRTFLPGTSMREFVLTIALSDQPCCIQYPRKS